MSSIFRSVPRTGFLALLLAFASVSEYAAAQNTVNFTQNVYQTTEDAGTVNIAITLAVPPGTGNTVTVEFSTQDGTALAGEDYSAQTGTVVTFADDQVQQSVVVSLIDDDIAEGRENLTLRLANPVNATLGANAIATLFIYDDEQLQCSAAPATFSINGAIIDNHALLPLNEWMPLFQFDLRADQDPNIPGIFARRELGFLTYSIVPTPEERPYAVDAGGPTINEIFQFSVWLDNEDAEGNLRTLGIEDTLLGTWDNTGFPFGNVTNPFSTPTYSLDLRSLNLEAAQPDPNSYIVAVQTSALWQNHMTMSVELPENGAILVDPDTGDLPVDCGGAPIEDSNLLVDNGGLVLTTAYSSNFSVYDITGNATGPRSSFGDNPPYNVWNWNNRILTPINDHARPRFDVPGTFFDLSLGEWGDFRDLGTLEEWIPVLGISMHAGSYPNTQDSTHFREQDEEDAEHVYLREVNIIFQDVGGDPFGVPGNGGFDPRQGLDHFTDVWAVDPDAVFFGRDIAFNSVWIWHDTTQDGTFNPPELSSLSGDAGITNTDQPMIAEPGFIPDTVDGFEPGWEYIPFPPGGGDPWWKIRLRVLGGRRASEDVERLEGTLEFVPDGNASTEAADRPDFFVVVHPDSGYQDASGRPGDGTAFRLGADFKAFIEPRRFNPNTGSLDGGIMTNGQISPLGFVLQPGVVSVAWQDDPLWDFPNAGEPWWPQRTSNPDVVKPVRVGFELHDLILTYSTNSDSAALTDIFYGGGGVAFGHVGFGISNIDRWMDPFGLRRALFFYNLSPGVTTEVIEALIGTPIGQITTEDFRTAHQFSYETVPFQNNIFDFPPFGPRSEFYAPPFMRGQPTTPDYSTWLPFQNPPSALPPGQYPREFDWAPEDRRARRLKQRIDSGNRFPILGLNMVGSNDPVVNRINPQHLQEITIAFWGAEFEPDDLLPLDPTGISQTSGVVLFEDFDRNGIFVDLLGTDVPVPLIGLEWPEDPERLDLDGDGIADDLNGDGVVNASDRAYVLTLRPRAPWRLPDTDIITGTDGADDGGGDEGDGGDEEAKVLASSAGSTVLVVNPRDGSKSGQYEATMEDLALQGAGKVFQVDVDKTRALSEQRALEQQAKALPAGGNIGDDLFVVVNTSENLARFEKFRILVPARLPDRTGTRQAGGIKFFPQLSVSAQAYEKSHPEEGAVQEFYAGELSPQLMNSDGTVKRILHGHDLVEANVGVRFTVETGPTRQISVNSRAVSLLGIDVSTNRGESAGIFARGESATLTPQGRFQVVGSAWPVGGLIGFWLIDSSYRSFEIVDNTSSTLTLRSGTPELGPWIIARDPTFLEQVVVELYNEGADRAFDYLTDLAPLARDQSVSGLAIYRDNDRDPNNTNGIFDEDIDIPIDLDYEPFRIGVPGEPDTQIKFVFSSPGTDDIPVRSRGSDTDPNALITSGLANQPHRRQWVPDTFALDPGLEGNEFNGPEFFVVARTSADIEVDDDFRAGIVSWGPATPTEPDPDSFPPPPAAPQDEFDIFSEYPWGNRGVGFITFFQTPPDDSGVNWIRTHPSEFGVTGVVRAVETVVDPTAVVIDSATPARLNRITPAGGIAITIRGRNFGPIPTVTFEGIQLEVISATDIKIVAIIPAGTVLTIPVSLTVRNPITRSQATRTDLWNILSNDPPAPRPTITSITPPQGDQSVFPITITGTNYDSPSVFLGGTEAPVLSSTSTQILVGFPGAGIEGTGPIDVAVVNQTGAFVVLEDGFNFINVNAVSITGAVPTVLPPVLPETGWGLIITGTNFGTNPVVQLEAIPIDVLIASNTEIIAFIPPLFELEDPVLLSVLNPTINSRASRDDLITVSNDPLPPSPEILGIDPDTGDDDAFPITITGTNFDEPRVFFERTELIVISWTPTSIVVDVPEDGLPIAGPQDIVVLNSLTGAYAIAFDAFDYFFLVPSVLSVSPDRGNLNDFPVEVFGENFIRPRVFFGETEMPVLSFTETRIEVGFPVGALPRTGPLDVRVENFTGADGVLEDGFYYENPPLPTPRACFIATAAYGTPFAGKLDTFRAFRDDVLLKTSFGVAFVDWYYTVSPAIADEVAASPALAAGVRLVLTPVAVSLVHPWMAVLVMLASMAAAAGGMGRLRRIRATNKRASL